MESKLLLFINSEVENEIPETGAGGWRRDIYTW